MSQQERGSVKKRKHVVVEKENDIAEPVTKMVKENPNILSLLNVTAYNFKFFFEELTNFIKRIKTDAYTEDSNVGQKSVYMIKTTRLIMSNALTIADIKDFLRPSTDDFKEQFDYFTKVYLAPNNGRHHNETQELDMYAIMKRPFFKAGMVFISLYLNKFDHFSVPYDLINEALDHAGDMKQQDPVEFWRDFFEKHNDAQQTLPSFEYFQMLSQYLYQAAELMYFKKRNPAVGQPIALRRVKDATGIYWVTSKAAMLPKKALIVERCKDTVRAKVTESSENAFLLKHFTEMPKEKYLILIYFYKYNHFAYFYRCLDSLIHEIFKHREINKPSLISHGDAELIEKRLNHFYTHGLWRTWSAERVLKTLMAIAILSITKYVHQDLLFYWENELQSCNVMRNKFTKMISDHDNACVCHVRYHMPHTAQDVLPFDEHEWKKHRSTDVGMVMFFLYAFSAAPNMYVPMDADAVEINKKLENFAVPHTFLKEPHYFTNGALIEMD